MRFVSVRVRYSLSMGTHSGYMGYMGAKCQYVFVVAFALVFHIYISAIFPLILRNFLVIKLENFIVVLGIYI